MHVHLPTTTILLLLLLPLLLLLLLLLLCTTTTTRNKKTDNPSVLFLIFCYVFVINSLLYCIVYIVRLRYIMLRCVVLCYAM